MMSEQCPVRSVRAKEQVPYTCRRCAACCRDIEAKLLLEPPDAYYLARCLQEQGQAVHDVEDVYAQYARPALLEDLFPIYLMKTQGDDHACVFLDDGKCTVYEARPRTCRLYPFTIDIGKRGQQFAYFQCVDRHAAHFAGRPVSVGDWMYHNFSREAKAFIKRESVVLPELGRLLQKLGAAGQKEVLFQVLFYRYYNYDLKQSFLTQYEANQKALLQALKQKLGKEE